MSNPIDQQTGLALAYWGYTPPADVNRQTITLPPGWEVQNFSDRFGADWNVQKSASGTTVENQFQVIVNRDENQIVISFKGSDTQLTPYKAGRPIALGLILAAMFLSLNPASAREGGAGTSSPEFSAPPPPTEAQLKLGCDLLNKIAYVVENVPLHDAAAVMKVFGFSNLYTAVAPTYVRLEPVGRTTRTAQPLDLTGTGFTYINVDPSVRSKKVHYSAGASARFNPKEACISLNAVRARFREVRNFCSRQSGGPWHHG